MSTKISWLTEFPHILIRWVHYYKMIIKIPKSVSTLTKSHGWSLLSLGIRFGGLSNYYNNMYKTKYMINTTRYYALQNVRKISTLNYSLMVDRVFEYNTYIYNFILVEINDFHFDQYLMVDSILSRKVFHIAFRCKLKTTWLFIIM